MPDMNTHSTASHELRRRTVIAGAAWTVPAIIAATAVPAYATSVDSSLTLSIPNSGGFFTSTTATATVKASTGTPWPGQPVVLQLTGPFTFSDGSTTFTGQTTAAGVLAVTILFDQTAPTGSLGSLTAYSGPKSAQVELTGLSTSIPATGSLTLTTTVLPPQWITVTMLAYAMLPSGGSVGVTPTFLQASLPALNSTDTWSSNTGATVSPDTWTTVHGQFNWGGGTNGSFGSPVRVAVPAGTVIPFSIRRVDTSEQRPVLLNMRTTLSNSGTTDIANSYQFRF
jgi:hypothetical protein